MSRPVRVLLAIVLLTGTMVAFADGRDDLASWDDLDGQRPGFPNLWPNHPSPSWQFANQASVEQRGSAHSVVIEQAGKNFVAATQLGRNQQAELIQAGMKNLIYLYQAGDGNQSTVSQIGVGNKARIGQIGAGSLFPRLA
jgi:hypothetical protein